MIPTDGGEARLLLRRNESIEGVAWSPDGRRGLFLSNVGEDEEDVRTIRRINFWFNDKGFIYNVRKHIFQIDLETKEAKQLTKGEFDVTKAAWSHDGRQIAYVAQTDDRRPYLQDLFIYEVASKKKRQLTKHNMEIASVAWSPDDRQLAFLGNDFPRGFASHNHLWLIGASGGSPTRLDDLDRSLQNGLNSDVRLGGVNSDPKWVGDRIYHLVAEGGSVHQRSGRCQRCSTCTVGRRPLSATATSMNSRCSQRKAMRCSSPTREVATATRKTSRTSGATMASEITSISWRRWTSLPRSIRSSTPNASRSRAARMADS